MSLGEQGESGQVTVTPVGPSLCAALFHPAYFASVQKADSWIAGLTSQCTFLLPMCLQCALLDRGNQ